MEPLYLGPRHWPLTPPLEILQCHGSHAGLILTPTDLTPENHTLLQKILAAVKWEEDRITLYKAHQPLSWGRLALLPYPYLWVFGKTLLAVPVGLYEAASGQRLTGIPPKKTTLVWRLPTLSEMQNNPTAKQEAWQWLKPLTSKS